MIIAHVIKHVTILLRSYAGDERLVAGVFVLKTVGSLPVLQEIKETGYKLFAPKAERKVVSDKSAVLTQFIIEWGEQFANKGNI